MNTIFISFDKHIKRAKMIWVWCSMFLSCLMPYVSFANEARTLYWAGNKEVVFYLDFENSAYALKALGNPYPVGSDFTFVPDDRGGKAWQNTSRSGFIAFDGTQNIPIRTGTISLWIKAGKNNIFTDKKRHSIAVLLRSTEGMAADKTQWIHSGLTLSLRKTEHGTLDLIAHAGGDSWARNSKATTIISMEVRTLSAQKWHHVAFSWDFTQRILWLAVNGKFKEGRIPEIIKKPHPYLAVVFGNTENYELSNQEPLDCLLDEIAILDVSYPQARQIFRTKARYKAPQTISLRKITRAVLFADKPDLARCEEVARSHLDWLVATQRHGGWALAIKWPSALQYTINSRLPEPRNLIWSSKNSHTAFAAALLIWAYEALGDEKYLEAAKRTAEMYLAVQDSTQGYWVHSYYYENGRYLPSVSQPLIQDHCQTGPLFLLAYMYRVTQDRRYLQAAIKNADFLLQSQNSNGSWPHHYDPVRRIGLGQGERVGQGEINDYGTSGPIEALLAMSQLTNRPDYRNAALKGADWLADALIENEKVVGWAAQYDDKNRPIPARHHEPSSVTQYAARWAAKGLLAAFKETRDEKYLQPLQKTLNWFDANKLQGGWWWDYDVNSGRPIRMVKRQIYFLDDPNQMDEYLRAGGDNAPMRGDWVNVEQLRREVQNATNSSRDKISSQPSREELKKYVDSTSPRYVRSFIEGDSAWNPIANLYTFPSASGLSTDLVRHQVVRFCDLLMRARAARGDIPAKNPLFRHNEAFVGWNKVLTHSEP